VVVALGWVEGAAAAAATVEGRVEVVAGLVVVTLFKVVEVGGAGLVEALTAVEDAGGEGLEEVVPTRVVDVVLGAVVGGAVVATGSGESSQLIARALPDPPATCGFLSGVLLEGDPSPPNSTTAIT
jgi:hypothetical protein